MSNSSFKNFVLSRIDPEKWKNVHELIGENNIAMGRVFKKPETASHEIILKIAELIDIHPFTLIDTYNMGAKKLSEAEKELHKKDFLLESAA